MALGGTISLAIGLSDENGSSRSPDDASRTAATAAETRRAADGVRGAGLDDPFRGIIVKKQHNNKKCFFLSLSTV